MVSLFHFLDLDINEQAEYVWQGTYLATRIEKERKVLLYNLGEYYAEVFYDDQTNSITYIKGFRATSHLAPYLNPSL
jgi:hypothetical protein